MSIKCWIYLCLKYRTYFFWIITNGSAIQSLMSIVFRFSSTSGRSVIINHPKCEKNKPRPKQHMGTHEIISENLSNTCRIHKNEYRHTCIVWIGRTILHSKYQITHYCISVACYRAKHSFCVALPFFIIFSTTTKKDLLVRFYYLEFMMNSVNETTNTHTRKIMNGTEKS